MTYPTLVQRVRRRPVQADKKGIDSLFEFDYMGASEFEWGSLPKALKAFRAAKPTSTKGFVVEVGTFLGAPPVSYTAWMVGAPTTQEIARDFFVDQLKPRADRVGHTKEYTGIRETYFPSKGSSKFDGWWAIDEDVPPFALFKLREHAETWLGAL